jgi:hypothetical protein
MDNHGKTVGFTGLHERESAPALNGNCIVDFAHCFSVVFSCKTFVSHGCMAVIDLAVNEHPQKKHLNQL